MSHRPLLPLALAAALLGTSAAQAQTGGAVPPYQPPEKVAPPVRDQTGNDDAFDRPQRADPFAPQTDTIAQFAGAYQGNGRPRLAFYWNRQLTDTLNQWYSDTRIVNSTKSDGSMSGDITLNQSNNSQNTIEIQRRSPDERRRPQPTETWEWEFQDGFLGPFLQAGATVLDRTAIIRITGADLAKSDDLTIETKALQGMADLLVEVLVTPSGQATTGYELRARILDVRTGRIVAYVSSRGLKEWNAPKQYEVSSHGIDLPDEDDDSFGPESTDRRFKADSHGFHRSRKPPKLRLVSQNLAYNVMQGMMNQWGVQPAGQIQPPPSAAKPAKTQRVPKPAAATSPRSVVPEGKIETRQLPPPPAEEPPMPAPTQQ